VGARRVRGRLPKVTFWHESGNTQYRTASVERVRRPLHLYLVDAWLAYGHAPLDHVTNWLQDRGRVDLSWWFAWPCYGYTQVWLPWLLRHQDTHSIEIDFDRLSPEARQDLERRDVELSDSEPG
jgi:hypothetical protein